MSKMNPKNPIKINVKYWKLIIGIMFIVVGSDTLRVRVKINLHFLSVKALAWQGAKAPRKDNGIFDSNIEIFQAFATQPGRMNWPLKM
jgi:hypothetical protein